jgi:hypothetical protein
MNHLAQLFFGGATLNEVREGAGGPGDRPPPPRGGSS